MFDSHCHPTDIEYPNDVIRQAVGAGLQSLLACGYNAKSNAEVEALHDSVPALPVAIGLHPWFANESSVPLLDQIIRTRAVAIGECGLDGSDDPSIPPLPVQRVVFEHQLQLAKRLAMPVTVHSRKAVNVVAETTRRFPGVRGIMHAFGGSYEQAVAFIDCGWLIGIGGAVTRVGAKKIRRLAERLPLSSLALETDAPAIGMEGIVPPSVRPAHLPLVAEAIAELRGISKDEVSAVTDANVDSLFGFHVTQKLDTIH